MRGQIESFDSNFLLAVALPRKATVVVASPPLLSIQPLYSNSSQHSTIQ